MTVYVGVPMWDFGRMKMCHMVADTEAELDEMARRLGLRPEWKQTPRGRRIGSVGALVHFDIAKSKRKLAVEHGAVPLDTLAAEATVLERLAAAEAPRGS